MNTLRDFNVLLPVDDLSVAQGVLPIATALLAESDSSHVNVIGMTQVATDSPLSEATLPAQRLRTELDRIADENPRIERLSGSLVSHEPWEDIKEIIDRRRDEHDLLVLPWQADTKLSQPGLERVLKSPPCDIVLVQPTVHLRDIRRILLPIRGGPFASLSLHLAVRLARAANAEITLLRVLPSDDDPMSQLLRERFTGLSDTFPQITMELQTVGEAGAAIMRELKDHQAVILGASAVVEGPILGPVASLILQRQDVTALIVRTKEPFRLPLAPARQPELPVLVRVEKWFAENTFHSREFSDIGRLIELKNKQGVRISLGLPSYNEEATIGDLIQTMKTQLMDNVPLLDEIVLIDSNSTDRTRKIAAGLGVMPYVHQETLSRLGSFRGKGEALWKSLYLLKGDLIVWMDTDIVDPHPRLVYGIVGPLLMDQQIQYVKGFYQRPVLSNGNSPPPTGGLVSELFARPMINLFFPELSGVVQPLAGIYGGRRDALEQMPFYSGHGVEIGLLLDLLEMFGLKAIAQVDLEQVTNQNRAVRTLSKKSFAILQVFAHHLQQRGLIDSQTTMERTMKLFRVEADRFYLEEIDVREQRRPPMIEVKEYRGGRRPRLARL